MTPTEFEAAVGEPLEKYALQCHVASLALVKSGTLPDAARVARGTCRGVGGQHSWVVLGAPYADDVEIIDPTLWSYDDTVTGIWTGSARDRRHRPHGAGSIWSYGVPAMGGGPAVARPEGLSGSATSFLDLVESAAEGVLDIRGWANLLMAPVLGWPAAEIHRAAWLTPHLKGLAPIDVVGMLTDLNPHGLYLPGEEKTS